MRFIISVTVFYSFCTLAAGQGISKTEWYSETNTNGIIVQNSFPKGGPYKGPTKKNFNYSHLVFFTRVVNETETPLELMINFSADSIPIPHSPDTFVKVFLPSDTMTFDKQSLFDYGVTDLESFDKPTRFQKTIGPNEECLFYVEAIFYQTKATAQNQDRGGNRAELVLKGQDLFFRMPPQIDSLSCGQIISKRSNEAEQVEYLMNGRAAEMKKNWAADFTVNNPFNVVQDGATGPIQSGTLTYSKFERNIEKVLVHDSVVVVMGNELVVPKTAPKGSSHDTNQPIKRRFTNVWMYKDGKWLMIARHASNICPN